MRNENNPDYVDSDKVIGDLENECDNLEDTLDRYSRHVEDLDDMIDLLIHHLDEEWVITSDGQSSLTKARSLIGKLCNE